MLIDLYLQGRLPLDALRLRDDRHRRRRGRLRQDARAATCCARSSCCERATCAIDHGVTSGTFSLDGETFDVDNNVWVVGDDDECVVIDAPHDVDAILGRRRRPATCWRSLCTPRPRRPCPGRAGAGRRVDGAGPAAPRRPPAVGADPSRRGAGRRPRRRQAVERRRRPTLEVVHTPGHSPGGVCFYSADLGVVFTGDTLFQGGPGATGRSYSDYEDLVTSIRTSSSLCRETLSSTPGTATRPPSARSSSRRGRRGSAAEVDAALGLGLGGDVARRGPELRAGQGLLQLLADLCQILGRDALGKVT